MGCKCKNSNYQESEINNKGISKNNNSKKGFSNDCNNYNFKNTDNENIFNENFNNFDNNDNEFDLNSN